MKEIYWKIIELEEHQVLVSKEEAPEEEESEAPHRLCTTFHLNGVEVKMTGAYILEEIRNEKFNNYNADYAQELVNRIKKSFE